MRRAAVRIGALCAAVTLASAGLARAAETVLVESGSPMKYLRNDSDPLVGLTWKDASFPDGSWTDGVYGVGYETSPPGATGLLQTPIAPGAFSVYTRARFDVGDATQVDTLLLGADFDDGYAAWVNGTLVYRSPQITTDTPAWNHNAASHESSNSTLPNYGTLVDITAAALPVLQDTGNVLAVGVWNHNAPSSSDMVVVPRLSMRPVSPLTRGPYLQRAHPTGLVVRWRTAAASDSMVWFGTDPGSLTAQAFDPAVTTEHEVELVGLEPDTRYYYAVGTSGEVQSGGDPDHVFETPPPIGTGKPTRIWVIGDSGTANGNARAVYDAYRALTGAQATDLWLMLGDNAYPIGTDAQYQAAVFDMYPELLRQTVLWPTLGNHDGASADSASETGPYYDIFTLPRQGEAGGLASGTEAYYSFDYGNIHFICLESFETDRSPGGAMMTWMQQDIMATSQDWVIAFWHHPPYSKGSHNSDTEIELIQMRTNALPILEAGGVDLVLAGHSHSYERSYLLDGHYGLSGTLTEAMKIDPGDGRIDGTGGYQKPSSGPAPHEGAVYIVAGSSGQTSGGSLDHNAMFLSLSELGSLVLEFNGQQLDVQFLDSGSVWRDGFSLFKGPLPPPVADFTAVPLSGAEPLTVSFTDLTTNGPSGREWDFEDDTIVDSTQQNPSHEYASPGLYTVRLTAFSGASSDDEVKPEFICVTSASGLGDADGDGVPDAADLCPCAADPSNADTDGDGVGDVCDDDDDDDGVPDGLDCAPLDPGASQVPGEVGDTLQIGSGKREITWVNPVGIVLSNLYRGTITGGVPFSYNHSCLVPGSTTQAASDPRPASAGTAFYYLVSAVNVCGEGPLGQDSSGTPRPNNSPCP